MTHQEYVRLLKDVEGAGVSSTRFGNIPMFWKNAVGCKVYDLNNQEYLDCTSSYGVMGIGYSHSSVIKAIVNTAHSITHSMCEIYPTPQYALTLDKIRTVLGRQEDQVILTTSGSDAVDVAIKLAFRYTQKSGIIAFQNAFHGQTLNSLNVTGQDCFRRPFLEILPRNVSFVAYPNCYRNPFDSEEELLAYTEKEIETIIQKREYTEKAIGAIIIEPMQNAAGYIIPPRGFLSMVKKICIKYNMLMIDDEIFTGFGRCGKWLMAEYEKIKADLICVGKVMTGGVPAAACIAPKHIMASLDYPGMVPLHGSTFTGNAIACSAISATIDVIISEDLIDKSAKTGETIRSTLRELFKDLQQVGDIRGVGSATMIEFVDNRRDKKRNPSAATCFSNFLLSKHIISLISGLPYGNCVALCTPFIMNEDEINQLFSACKEYATFE